jgi:hypothetical protein
MNPRSGVLNTSGLPVVLNALLILGVLLLAAAAPPAHGAVAVFAAPWSDGAAAIVAEAGGRLVAGGRWPWIILAVANDGELAVLDGKTAVSGDGEFVSRLYRAGAILVADPKLAVGCHTDQRPQDPP